VAEAPLRVVVLVSGSGSNLQSLIDTVHAPGGDIEIVLVVSSKPGVPALERAERAGIPTTAASMHRQRHRSDRAPSPR
jgi:phosphoribosylglycinamide formyltransferase-1